MSPIIRHKISWQPTWAVQVIEGINFSRNRSAIGLRLSNVSPSQLAVRRSVLDVWASPALLAARCRDQPFLSAAARNDLIAL
jgi:hypothetical protein